MPRKQSEKSKLNIQALHGGQVLSKAAALRGIQPLQKQFSLLTASDSKRQRDVAERMNAIYASLHDERKAVAAIRTFQSRYARSRYPKAKSPQVQKESQHIYLGSLGAFLPPPFQYEWTWRSQNNVGVSASAAKGELRFDCDSGGNDFDGSAASAVGIYFRPIIDRGILAVWSFPPFWSFWFDYAYFAAAASSAFLGLYVARYDIAGNFTGAVVDQRNTLWDDSSHISDSGWHEESSRGYPLSAICPVERTSQYIIWVWCGGHAFADRILGGAGAESMIYVTVPAIAWQLN